MERFYFTFFPFLSLYLSLIVYCQIFLCIESLKLIIRFQIRSFKCIFPFFLKHKFMECLIRPRIWYAKICIFIHKERQEKKNKSNQIIPFNKPISSSPEEKKTWIHSFHSLTFISNIHLNIKYSLIDSGSNSCRFLYMFRFVRKVRKILRIRILFCVRSILNFTFLIWNWDSFHISTKTSCLVPCALYRCMLNAYYVSHDDLCIISHRL